MRSPRQLLASIAVGGVLLISSGCSSADEGATSSPGATSAATNEVPIDSTSVATVPVDTVPADTVPAGGASDLEALLAASIEQCAQLDVDDCDEEEAPELVRPFCEQFVGDLAGLPWVRGDFDSNDTVRLGGQCAYLGADAGAVPAGSDAELYVNLLYDVDMTAEFLSDYGIYVAPSGEDAEDLAAACAAADGIAPSDSDVTIGCLEDGDRAVYTRVHEGSAKATFVDGNVVVAFFWDPAEEINPAVAATRFGAIVERVGLDMSGLDFAALFA